MNHVVNAPTRNEIPKVSHCEVKRVYKGDALSSAEAVSRLKMAGLKRAADVCFLLRCSTLHKWYQKYAITSFDHHMDEREEFVCGEEILVFLEPSSRDIDRLTRA